MFRRAVLTGLAIALAVLVMTPPAQAKVAWSKCFGGPFQCGVVQVPLDYDQPNGTQIQIALIRLRAIPRGSNPTRSKRARTSGV